MSNGTYPRNFECILVDKVFDSCLKKVCFDDLEVALPDDIDLNFCDVDIRFENGIIKPGSLKVLESSILPPDCKRVKLTVLIRFTVIITCNGRVFEIPGTLPPIDLDVVMFHPDARSEFKFDVLVETQGELLDDSVESGCGHNEILKLAIGVFIILKIVGKVQIKLDKQFPYCVPPRDCKDFSEMSPCDDFESHVFPSDFYPDQATSIYPCGE